MIPFSDGGDGRPVEVDDPIDAALFQAAGHPDSSGDQAAFARFYDLTAPAVFGVVLRVVRSRALAEEVSQEVFTELWRTAGRFDPALGSAKAWACSIAHRRAVDRVRSEQASRTREDRAGAPSPSPHDVVVEEVEARLERDEIGAAMGQLSELQREAVSLAFYGGHTYVGVASLLGVPEGTIKTRIRDGLIRIRDIMEGHS